MSERCSRSPLLVTLLCSLLVSAQAQTDGSGSCSCSNDYAECSGADPYPDAAAACDAAFVGAVRRLHAEHRTRAEADQLAAAGSAHSRRQAVHLADRRYFAGDREQSRRRHRALQPAYRRHRHSSHQGRRIVPRRQYRRGAGHAWRRRWRLRHWRSRRRRGRHDRRRRRSGRRQRRVWCSPRWALVLPCSRTIRRSPATWASST